MKYFKAISTTDPEDVLYVSGNCDRDTVERVAERLQIEAYGYKLEECSKEEFETMTQDQNDYIINVGQTRDDIGPFESAYTEEEAVERAEQLCKEYKCVEIVYMPQDNIDINETIWSWYDV
jgi:hypothetical protein